MAAARPQKTEGDDGAEGAGGDAVPLPFRQAVEALKNARTRPEVALGAMPAPKRLAPFAYALEASVTAPHERGAEDPEDAEELADGRFVLLHDPDGQESWQGTFRVVTLSRADLEQELATDPLLPEVTWSWLTGALESQGLAYREPSGTVTRSGSYFFGGLAERTPRSELELRASWTPVTGDGGEVPDVAGHLAAWCELLCQCAGFPPERGEPGEPGAPAHRTAVVQLPQRRGPRSL
ncbi:DUF3000 domain-containing protein [Streptomyces sp. HNM0574]|uniref:DUF3000 domain-containing protein n=1 Tax=Streptomyces sp. HNM0574 TaxID=2714954 RepID=UPI00146F6ADC|nr:DUF3000 domain-containing protein [Streptomyces sp. HNM0574]NLU65824.1 DUF3000 domain-containing protein [Streptomyces sp. HNM0574]